ncbi:MAG: copper homeostasis protein CutC [Alistipes sp.]|nr:copper homeostasis protein CutC [Alistipes sp.]
MKTELCAYSVEACRIGAQLGVDRVELCASPAEGGVTPSLATIERVAEIKGLDVSVMIRPRGGDFLYSDDEFQTMLRDIEYARKAGATGVVFGILTADGKVDVERTRALVEAAGDMETTFHRAVDMTENYLEAVEAVIEAGCKRILTSGGYDKAIEGKENIARAVEISRGRIEIMAGSGVVASNAKDLADLGVDALHFSAKTMVAGGMKYRNPRISMGGTTAVDEFAIRTVDTNEVKEILKLIR